jgi:flagellar motor switch protein FliN/FliY
MEVSSAKKPTGAETEIALRPGQGTDHASGANSAPEAQEDAGDFAAEVAESSHAGWPVVDWLPISLSIGLPIPSFRVRDLLMLEIGSVVVTEWPNGDDLPLSAGAVQLAWVDVETVEQEMAVRLTRLL